MPEGPEIRHAADAIASAIGGRVATRVYFRFEALRPLARYLRGEVVASVDTRGKALLIRFANGLVVFTHSQLYGRWVAQPSGPPPPTRRELRLAIYTEDGAARLYSASEIDVLDEAGLETHPFLSRLGPDALSPDLLPEMLETRLRDRAFARRRIGALLLDQGFVAGLGNYLRSEILHVARLHPALRPADCTRAQVAALARAICALPLQSYEERGVTNDLARAAGLAASGMQYGDFRFRVFGREGDPCYDCCTAISRLEAAGRRVYVCPRCQSMVSTSITP